MAQPSGYVIDREDILNKAKECVCTGRGEEYTEPENNFGTIALFWNTYLVSKRGISPCIDAGDVAVMMALLKIARISDGKFKVDSFVDACGYLACGGELQA